MGKHTTVIGLRKPTELECEFIALLTHDQTMGRGVAQEFMNNDPKWADLRKHGKYHKYLGDHVQEYISKVDHRHEAGEVIQEIENALLSVEAFSYESTANSCEDMVRTVHLANLPISVVRLRFCSHK